MCGHVGFPLQWSGSAHSKRFDAHSTWGWVSRDPDATNPSPTRDVRRHRGVVWAALQGFAPRRNLGTDPCAPSGVHLTSQQHRSASTADCRSTSRRIASAQPVTLKTPQPTAPPPGVLVRHEGLTQ
ncbi:hypothetical protein STRTUCAR8_07928 [Streptomyces turgidiscabies Car8]|uniref:Uncharacterized protein n=1 Tax=Streptomyces turgidiscabies (strain Car8) TaxID=698760 RepID=L7FJ82_STRT8|nr:hypothetical protein STRTUCAR8_07928 [Streptomyces turgidiscabies Car8]